MKTKLKRGDGREDGKVFWRYHDTSVNGQMWVSAETYQRKAAASKQRKRRWADKRKKEYEGLKKQLTRGTTRTCDNKIFWAYALEARGFEKWIEQDQYDALTCKADAWRQSKGGKSFHRNYKRERRGKDHLYKMETSIRSAITNAFNNKGFTKKSKTYQILGCSCVDFMKHLEGLFQEGMSFSNYGQWHIDHVLPLSAATTADELIKLNHYTNLQPLWAKDNLAKGDKHDKQQLKQYLNLKTTP